MTTELEIIDTAVKVGLGALISGITTYFVAMRSHSHEIRKSMLNERKELLKEAAIKIERCSTLGNELTDSLHQISISSVADKEKKFREATKAITTALNSAKEARSIFYMIGQSNLAKLTEKYFESIDEEGRYYEEKLHLYDKDEVDTILDKQSAIKKEILENLAVAFESIYS